ncbi:MAG: hypothetical protein ACKPKO_62310, partial [Candidatus Fonsibacter sp.]
NHGKLLDMLRGEMDLATVSQALGATWDGRDWSPTALDKVTAALTRNDDHLAELKEEHRNRLTYDSLGGALQAQGRIIVDKIIELVTSACSDGFDDMAEWIDRHEEPIGFRVGYTVSIEKCLCLKANSLSVVFNNGAVNYMRCVFVKLREALSPPSEWKEICAVLQGVPPIAVASAPPTAWTSWVGTEHADKLHAIAQAQLSKSAAALATSV